MPEQALLLIGINYHQLKSAGGLFDDILIIKNFLFPSSEWCANISIRKSTQITPVQLERSLDYECDSRSHVYKVV